MRILSDPDGPEFVRDLRLSARSDGEIARLHTLVDNALEMTPDSASWISTAGRLAELDGDTQSAREAYERSLRIHPHQVDALLGLAGLVVADTPQESAALVEHALEVKLEDVDVTIASDIAAQLSAGGHDVLALPIFAKVLDLRAYEGKAAEALARDELRVSGGTERALDLSRRAVRFSRSAESWRLLAQVYEARGESEQADRAKLAADKLGLAPSGPNSS
jgi:tetratricopeptide (TPR) repeat protein